ncbi:nuclear transport factor 2 family protein [Mycolicibacterium sp. XJ2]
MNERLQALCDRADIFDCMHRYARGMDRRDRELVRSAYHDGAVDEHIGFVGPVDDFIEWAFAYHETQPRYQHYLLNHTADITGDQAHAETYYLFVGTDRAPANHLTVNGGRYIDRLERRDGRWAIAARVCVVEWHTEGTTLITDETMGFLADILTVAHDRSDISYERPLNPARIPSSS